MVKDKYLKRVQATTSQTVSRLATSSLPGLVDIGVLACHHACLNTKMSTSAEEQSECPTFLDRSEIGATSANPPGDGREDSSC